MICPGCGAKGVEHAYARTDNPPCGSWPKCPRCAQAHNGPEGYRASAETETMVELGICWICAFRENAARRYAAGKCPNLLIIGGATYSADPRNTVALGAPDPNPRATMRGMAGRRFDIERLDGSAPKSCYSLWYGSEVDEWSRDRMPDNARFVGGAKRVQVGSTTCFNPSRPASADTRPEGGDATEIAAPFTGGAVGSEADETPNLPTPSGEHNHG